MGNLVWNDHNYNVKAIKKPPCGDFLVSRIRFVSLRSATTELSDYAQKTEKWSKQKTSTQMLTWKPKCGKNHGSPQTAKYTMGEEYNNENTQRQRPFVLFFATRGGYSRGNDLSLSLSLSLSLTLSHAISVHTRYTTTYKEVEQQLSTTTS